MPVKHLCVLVHISEVGAVKHISAPVNFLVSVTRLCFFCGSFLIFVFHACLFHTVSSVPCNLVVRYWKRDDFLYFVCNVFL